MNHLPGCLAILLCGSALCGCRPEGNAGKRVLGTVKSSTNRLSGSVNTYILLEDGTHIGLLHGSGLLPSSITITLGGSRDVAAFTNENGVVRPLTDAEHQQVLRAQQHWRNTFEDLGNAASGQK